RGKKRKEEMFVSESGLISIAGGKLTGYRKMAETVVDIVEAQSKSQEGIAYGACRTKHLPISGGNVGGSANFPAFMQEKVRDGMQLGLSEDTAKTLVQRYGSNITQLYDIIIRDQNEATSYGLPSDLFAMILYSIEQEMVTKPVDFFIRRTGALFFNINWVRQWKEPVMQYMAER
ncbi:unnamed protein product, partial [marine sediment metagenome]